MCRADQREGRPPLGPLLIEEGNGSGCSPHGRGIRAATAPKKRLDKTRFVCYKGSLSMDNLPAWEPGEGCRERAGRWGREKQVAAGPGGGRHDAKAGATS